MPAEDRRGGRNLQLGRSMIGLVFDVLGFTMCSVLGQRCLALHRAVQGSTTCMWPQACRFFEARQVFTLDLAGSVRICRSLDAASTREVFLHADSLCHPSIAAAAEAAVALAAAVELFGARLASSWGIKLRKGGSRWWLDVGHANS